MTTSTDTVDAPSLRDRYVRLMADTDRIGRQRATGYGRRNLVETTIGRYEHRIGLKLRARTLPVQQGEVTIAVQVLNRMVRVAKPVSAKHA